MARLENVERAAKVRSGRRVPKGAAEREALVRRSWAALIAHAQADSTSFDAWFFVGQTPDGPPITLLEAARSGAISDMTRQGVARFTLAAFLRSGEKPIRTDAAGHLLPDEEDPGVKHHGET